MFPGNQISELVSIVSALFLARPELSKEQLVELVSARLSLRRERSVFSGHSYAVRFSAVRGAGFPNTVLGLRVLQRYDMRPFIVCVIRPAGPEFLLANSTFLNKISHSSHLLSIGKVRGSFLGSDIANTFEGLQNRPENFEVLFKLHQERTWEQNLARLVHAASAGATQASLGLGLEARQAILGTAELSRVLTRSGAYRHLAEELHDLVQERSAEILAAAEIGNVNVRGNSVERLLTGRPSTHRLADLAIVTPERVRILVDIKTKLAGAQSSPKGVNVDKLLKELSDGRTVMSFLVVLVGLESRSVAAKLVSMLDRQLVARTTVQMHWSGRGTRGTTQITGDVDFLIAPGFEEDVDVAIAESFLERLMNGPD